MSPAPQASPKSKEATKESSQFVRFSWLNRDVDPTAECLICVLYENSPCQGISDSLSSTIDKQYDLQDTEKAKNLSWKKETSQEFKQLEKKELELMDKLKLCALANRKLFEQRHQEMQNMRKLHDKDD